MIRLLFRLCVLLALAASLAGCYGPSPAVVGQELRPPAAPGAPYTLVVTIENRSGGAGQAELTARLHASGDSTTAAQQAETVELEPHETVQVVFELRPPALGDYQAAVEVEYPPE
jgi:hypothetical protein